MGNDHSSQPPSESSDSNHGAETASRKSTAHSFATAQPGIVDTRASFATARTTLTSNSAKTIKVPKNSVGGMGLSDQDVQRQIGQMVAFIEQDAKEKAEEISQKAFADYNVEKSRMIAQAKTKLDAEKEKKLKQIDLQRKIHISTQINQQRLKVLKHREEHIAAVIDEAKARLAQLAQDPNLLNKILRGLVTQCLYQLLEENVELKVRSADLNTLKQVLPEAIDKYEQATARKINLTVNESDFLPDDQIGVEAIEAKGRRIRVLNTLDSRLDTVQHTKMPEIRQRLFPKGQFKKPGSGATVDNMTAVN